MNLKEMWGKKSKHPLYKILADMKTRCYNPNYIGTHLYMGKGITICDDWRYSFDNFYTWAINNGWEKGLTIDRIDSNCNYEPNNCRFATKTEQQRNRPNITDIETVKNIKKYMRDNPREKSRIVAEKFNVGYWVVYNIRRGYWANITP